MNGIIEFSAVGASRFYWVLVGFAALFVIAGIGVFIRSFGADRELVLGEIGLSCPQSGISSNIVQMDYADITHFDINTVQKQRFLRVVCGKRQLSIPEIMMPSKEVFKGVMKALEEKGLNQ